MEDRLEFVPFVVAVAFVALLFFGMSVNKLGIGYVTCHGDTSNIKDYQVYEDGILYTDTAGYRHKCLGHYHLSLRNAEK